MNIVNVEYPRTEIFVGLPGAGKTRKAKELAVGKSALFYDARDLRSERHFSDIFLRLRLEDELLVIDGLPLKLLMPILDYMLSPEMIINPKGKQSYKICRPRTIVTISCSDFTLPQVASYLRRYSVVKFPESSMESSEWHTNGFPTTIDASTSMQSFKHLMIDLETMGNRSGAVICAVGMVEFDIVTGETRREFYQKVSIQSCLDAGLKVDGSTIEWWLSQGEVARHELFGETHELSSVLNSLALFLTHFPDAEIWGNSARFDMGILEAAYHAIKLPIPWVHWNERDLRTLVSFNPEIKKSTIKTGIAHNAIDDCHHQIRYCSAIYNAITINN